MFLLSLVDEHTPALQPFILNNVQIKMQKDFLFFCLSIYLLARNLFDRRKRKNLNKQTHARTHTVRISPRCVIYSSCVINRSKITNNKWRARREQNKKKIMNVLVIFLPFTFDLAETLLATDKQNYY